jgi:hypothetical protein
VADASYVHDSFIGGEVSQVSQGHVTNEKYRSWMNRCRNSFSNEQGAWVRRSGTIFCGTTRNGAPGRVLPFQFKAALPYTMEFTDGFLRFRQGPRLVTTNDDVTVASISTANPAVVTVSSPLPSSWATGNQVLLNITGTEQAQAPRQFSITVPTPGGTTFSLQDPTNNNANVDGATLGGAFVSGTASRILEIATPYTSGAWRTLRAVQSEIPTPQTPASGAVLLHSKFPPYVLQVATQPTPTQFATFTFGPGTFRDGPYLDPVKGGAMITPSGLSGLVTMTITFPAFDSTIAYQLGDFVSNASVNYQSTQPINLGNTPPNAAFWNVVSSGVAIGPNGFQGSDLGRLMRFYSEPPVWNSATAYVIGNEVSYPSGSNGAYLYWKAVAASTGVTPGTDTTKWALDPAGAVWTWGRISLLASLINPATGTAIGTLTQGGGLAAAFDGITNQPVAASASFDAGGTFTTTQYIGKNYSTPQQISAVTVFNPSDQPLAFGFALFSNGAGGGIVTSQPCNVVVNLRAKATAPASSSDGVMLGTTGTLVNPNAPITIPSSDQTTAWAYVWVEITSTVTITAPGFILLENNRIGVAECQFFNPVAAGVGGSNAVQVQILGGKLLYTTPIRVWRMGLYTDTTGWPTCGTYHEGRLWLSGVYANRIDSSVSNDIFNFAPTQVDGSVPGDRGISYVFNSPDANPIFWLEPDQLGIVGGTQAGEWLVQATSTNLPLSPATIQAHRYTKYNCANILPARTDLTLAVVQTFRRSLLEYFADVFSGRFSAHDLAHFAKHLTAPFIMEICWQQETIATIWSRLGDGTWTSTGYSRRTLSTSQPAEMAAWAGHSLGTNRMVEFICTGANEFGTLDALTMVTNNPTGNVRWVEMLAKNFAETDLPANGWFLDGGVRPSSTTPIAPSMPLFPYGGIQLNGLWHLNGQIVQATFSGYDSGQQLDVGAGLPTIADFTVANGSVQIPYGDGVSGGPGNGMVTSALVAAALAASPVQVVVGMTYTSDGQIVRPNAAAEAGSRNGPAFGKLRRNQYYAMQAVQAAGLSIGTRFDRLDSVLFGADPVNDPGGPPLPIGQVYTGIFWAPLTDDNSFDGMICWRVSRPVPATIAAIGGFIHTQDK